VSSILAIWSKELRWFFVPIFEEVSSAPELLSNFGYSTLPSKTIDEFPFS
jgi:hypothetical protein